MSINMLFVTPLGRNNCILLTRTLWTECSTRMHSHRIFSFCEAAQKDTRQRTQKVCPNTGTTTLTVRWASGEQVIRSCERVNCSIIKQAAIWFHQLPAPLPAVTCRGKCTHASCQGQCQKHLARLWTQGRAGSVQ